MIKYFICGSRLFFSDYPDFFPKDYDIVLLDTDPKGYDIYRYSHLGFCLFEYKWVTKDEFIENALKGLDNEFTKFLNKEFRELIGFTIEDLKKLKKCFYKNQYNDHYYLKEIFDFCIENNSFELTKEQIDKAYLIYKKLKGEA